VVLPRPLTGKQTNGSDLKKRPRRAPEDQRPRLRLLRLHSRSHWLDSGQRHPIPLRRIHGYFFTHPEDLHEVMIRAEEHFTQKKPVNKKERLKEIAKEQGNKNTGGTMSDNKEPDKVESESSEEESEPEEKRDPKDPLFNIDKMVEVLAKEVKLDLGGGDDNAKKDAVNKLPSDKESHNPEPVSEHSKDISKTAKHNPDAPLIDLEELVLLVYS
jgi:hypothetical protein